MAAMTVASHETPLRSDWAGHGVAIKTITGAGTDLTTVAAAVAGKQHVIVGGEISAAGAGTVTIQSDATQLDKLVFTAEMTRVPFPVGLNTKAGEALKMDNSGVQADGWVAIATVTGKNSLGQLL